jgi:hypothetical protein
MIDERSADTFVVVERLLTTSYARDRVAEALYEILLDGLTCSPCDLPAARDREWIRGSLAVPIQETTSAALRALVWEMARALEDAPDGLLDRLDRSHRRSELGWE